MLRDWSLFTGEGGPLYLGGGSIFFELHFGEGRFFLKNSLRGGLRFFVIISIYHESLNSEFS